MSLPKRILVPTDFSATAEAALNYAKVLAEALGASLHVIHVMDDPLPGIKLPDHVGSIPAIRRQLEMEASEHLANVLTACSSNGRNAGISTGLVTTRRKPADNASFSVSYEANAVTSRPATLSSIWRDRQRPDDTGDRREAASRR